MHLSHEPAANQPNPEGTHLLLSLAGLTIAIVKIQTVLVGTILKTKATTPDIKLNAIHLG